MSVDTVLPRSEPSTLDLRIWWVNSDVAAGNTFHGLFAVKLFFVQFLSTKMDSA
jgi:hypothetical protein